MSEVVEINDYDEFIDTVQSNDRVVVDFSAPSWCRPCVQFAPHFEKAAEKVDALFVMVDIDKAPEIAQEFRVMSVPTVYDFQGLQNARIVKARTVVALISELETTS